MAQSRLGQNAILVPIGTTAERPSSPEAGEIRFNTDLDTFEGYDGISWGSIGRGTESQNISYDNTESGLAADNVQGAIDEVSEHPEEQGGIHGIPEGERAINSEELLAAVSEAEDIDEAVSFIGRGAIVESDSNSNGHYVRWENGEQVCWRTVTHDYNDSTAQTHSIPVDFVGNWSGGMLQDQGPATGPFRDSQANTFCHRQQTRWRTQTMLTNNNFLEPVHLFGWGFWK